MAAEQQHGGRLDRPERRQQRHLAVQIGACRRVLTESRALGRTEQFTPVRLNAAVELSFMA